MEGKVNMLEAPVPQVMERPYTQRQEKFIRLFVYTAGTLKEHLFGDKELTKRVADISSDFTQKSVPAPITPDLYHKAVDNNPADKLFNELIADKDISDLVVLNTARQIRPAFIQPEDTQTKARIAGMDDKEFAQYVQPHISSAPNVTFSAIAYHVCEAHRYFMQKSLVNLQPENTHL